jgi:hypothetical protein
MPTFKLSGNNSILTKKLYEQIRNENHTIALVGFYSTYVTPNVTKHKNKFRFISSDDTKISTFEISAGQYSLQEMGEYRLEDSIFRTKGLKHTNRVEVEFINGTNMNLNLASYDTLLGFPRGTLIERGKIRMSDSLAKLHPFDTINVHCNLADGMTAKREHEHGHK